MPYHIQKVGSGYYVVTTSTGRKHSKSPLTHIKAKAQLRALEANASPSEKERRKK